jgi:hypothetical protein
MFGHLVSETNMVSASSYKNYNLAALQIFHSTGSIVRTHSITPLRSAALRSTDIKTHLFCLRSSSSNSSRQRPHVLLVNPLESLPHIQHSLPLVPESFCRVVCVARKSTAGVRNRAARVGVLVAGTIVLQMSSRCGCYSPVCIVRAKAKMQAQGKCKQNST